MVRPLNPSEVVAVVWRQKAILFLVAGVMIISTFWVIRSMPDRYESTALVVVSSSEYKSPEDGAQIAGVIAQLASRTNLEYVVESRDLRAGDQSIDESIKALEKNITLDTKLRSDAPGFPESFHISYRSEDRQKAPLVLADLVLCFQKANSGISERKAKEEGAVNLELSELDAKARGHEGRAMRSGFSARSLDYGDIRSRKSNLQSAIQTLSAREFALQQQIADQERQIREQQSIARISTPGAEVRGSSSYGLLLIRRAELEAQLKEFSKQYTAQNPKVIQATTQLQEINRQIAHLEAGGEKDVAMATSPEGRELRALERELSRMKIDLETTRHEIQSDKQELSGLPAAATGGESAQLYNQGSADQPGNERLIERYTALLAARDSLNRLKIQGGGTFPDLFRVVDNPNQPLLPVGPNRRALMAIALGFALALGVIAAFLAGLPGLYVIDDEADVQYLLGTQVVALIPETLTPVERARSRALRLSAVIAFLIVAIAGVPLIVALLNGLQVFQAIAGK